MCQIHPRNQPIAKHDDKTGFDPEIIFLPDSYTPSDSHTELGLCSQNYKIGEAVTTS